MEKLIDRVEDHLRQQSSVKDVWRDFVTRNNVLVDLLVLKSEEPYLEYLAFKFFPSLFHLDESLKKFDEMRFHKRYAVVAKAPHKMSRTALSKFYTAGVGLLIVGEGELPLKGLLHPREDFKGELGKETFLPPRPGNSNKGG